MSDCQQNAKVTITPIEPCPECDSAEVPTFHAITVEELTALRARVEKLEAALEPFADFCRKFDGHVMGLASRGDDEIYCFHGPRGKAAITLAHVRKAREALENR
jgi:hypothetical protein